MARGRWRKKDPADQQSGEEADLPRGGPLARYKLPAASDRSKNRKGASPRKGPQPGRGGPGPRGGRALAARPLRDRAERASERPINVDPFTVSPLSLGEEGLVARCGSEERRLATGIPGEQLQLLAADPKRGAGERVWVTAPSPHRVTAPCSVLEQCGGCVLQAMDYPAQLEAKSEALSMALAGLGVEPDVAGAVTVRGLSRPLGQRSKLMMTAFSRGNRLRFGFYRRGTLQPVAGEGCPAQHPMALGLLAMAIPVLQAHGVRAADGRGRNGWLNALGIRVDPASGEAELVLSGRTGDPPGKPGALAAALERLPGVATVALCVCPTRSSYPMDGPFRKLAGRGVTVFAAGPRTAALSPGTFLQTCAEGAGLLCEEVLGLLPDAMPLLADLYCGAGTFVLAAAGRWERAVAVEQSAGALADLSAQLAQAPLEGLTLLPGSVEQRMAEVLALDPSAVLMDPPRRGCKPEVIEALLRRPPPVIVYAACGFQSFLADARRLLAGGYRMDAARAVDMFPHTTHLEVVARFARMNPDGGRGAGGRPGRPGPPAR